MVDETWRRLCLFSVSSLSLPLPLLMSASYFKDQKTKRPIPPTPPHTQIEISLKNLWLPQLFFRQTASTSNSTDCQECTGNVSQIFDKLNATRLRQYFTSTLFLSSRVLGFRVHHPFQGPLTHLCDLEAGYGGVWAPNFGGAAPEFEPRTSCLRVRSVVVVVVVVVLRRSSPEP